MLYQRKKIALRFCWRAEGMVKGVVVPLVKCNLCAKTPRTPVRNCADLHQTGTSLREKIRDQPTYSAVVDVKRML